MSELFLAFLAWFALQGLPAQLPPDAPQDLPAGRVSVCSQVYQGEAP